jgi:hypothetical protein
MLRRPRPSASALGRRLPGVAPFVPGVAPILPGVARFMTGVATLVTGLALLIACAASRTQEPEARPEPPPEPPADEAPDDVPLPVRQARPPPIAAPRVDLPEIEARAKEGEPEEVGVALTWKDRIQRDARITFSDRSVVDASACLDNPVGIGLRRAAAWMTLGSQGTPEERLRIERAVRAEQGMERRAAILALGQPRIDATLVLRSLIDDPDPLAAECALLALLKTGVPGARELVVATAADVKHPRANAATALLAFVENPSADRIPRAARTWFELRWEAARAFGCIDGQKFEIVRIAELAKDVRFCADVAVLGASRSLFPATKDHLLSVLLQERGPARLEAAVHAMARSLSRLVESELWKPADAAEWSALLAEIERERAEATTPEVLQAAEEILPVRWKARELLARSGRFDLASFSAIDLAALGPEERVSVCQILGSMTEPAAGTLLGRLADDADPGVRGAYLVARLRNGGASDEDDVDRALSDRSRPEHAAVLAALCRNAREPAIAERLERYVKKALGGELVNVAVALCEQGRYIGRVYVRSLLSVPEPPSGERRRMLARALCRRPSEQDRAILVELFPQPGEEDLNRDLAVGLARLSDPKVRPVLRSAFWGPSFDTAVLAGTLLAEELGLRGIVEDIRNPPPGTPPEKLRRAGFAIGEWGGIKAMNRLADLSGASAARPEVQGALLGVLGTRTQ